MLLQLDFYWIESELQTTPRVRMQFAGWFAFRFIWKILPNECALQWNITIIAHESVYDGYQEWYREMAGVNLVFVAPLCIRSEYGCVVGLEKKAKWFLGYTLVYKKSLRAFRG